jgi:REP element-mobilizing transposase RayT
LEDACRRSLQQPVTILPTELYSLVGKALRERLQGLGGLVVAVSVAAEHVHLLAKMPSCQARTWIGTAKRHAWFELRNRGWPEKLWGKRSQNVIVRDRQHQLNVYHYIVRHSAQGAWVWKWGDE